MDRGLYTAATGMRMAELTMDIVSNNLANVGTTGFKRDGLMFNEALDRVIRAEGGNGAVIGELGGGPGLDGTYTDFKVGALQATGNSLDLAITSEKGMFAIQTPEGVKYTRAGTFAMNENREIVDLRGNPVLDDSGSPITVPPGPMSISKSGLIEVLGQEVGQIGVYDGGFQKSFDGHYVSSNAVAMDPELVSVEQGFIESSNVNAIEEMITMIKLNRAFEMAQRSAQSQDESSSRLIQTLQG